MTDNEYDRHERDRIEDAVSHVPEGIRSIVRAALMAMSDMSSTECVEFLSALCRMHCRKCGRERFDFKCRCWEGVETW